MRRLREAFATRAKPGVDAAKAMALLEHASADAEVATTAAARAGVEEQFRAFEKYFLRPK